MSMLNLLFIPLIWLFLHCRLSYPFLDHPPLCDFTDNLENINLVLCAHFPFVISSLQYNSNYACLMLCLWGGNLLLLPRNGIHILTLIHVNPHPSPRQCAKVLHCKSSIGGQVLYFVLIRYQTFGCSSVEA